MNSTRDDTAWRRIAIGTFVTLLLVALVWNGAAFLIDASDLPDGGAWVSMSMFSMMGSMLFGGPAILMSLVVASVAASGTSEAVRPNAWLGAAVSAACSVGLLQFVPNLIGAPSVDAAFALVSLLLALVLIAPLLLCIRQHRSEQVRDGRGHS